MDLKTLQKEIDNNEFNPADYDQESLVAIDTLFRRGDLTGYSGVNEIAKERFQAKLDIGLRSMTSEQPTDPKKGDGFYGFSMSDRDKFSLTGEVAIGLTPYLPNSPILGVDRSQFKTEDVDKAFRRDPKNLKKTAYADTTRKIANVAGKLPVVGKIARPILNIGANFVSLFEQGARYLTLSNRGRQLTSSWLRSGAGAAGGSVIYDVYNNMKKEEFAALNKDVIPFEQLAGSSFDQLSTKEQMFQLALEKGKDSLFWNGGFIAGIPLASKVGGNFAKFLTGTGSQKSVELGRRAEKLGLPLDIAALARTDKGLGAFTKTYFQTVGILPFVSRAQKSRLRQFGSQAKSVYKDKFMGYKKSVYKDRFVEQYAPIMHSELLGAVTPSVLRQNYASKKNLIDASYDSAELAAQKMGNPAYIPTNNISAQASKLLSDDGIKPIQDYLAMNNIGSEQINRLFNIIGDTQGSGFPKNITPLQYKGLLESLNEVMDLLPKDNPSLLKIHQLKLALTNDINSLLDPKTKDLTMLDSGFKQKYDEVLKNQGKEQANQFLIKFNDDLELFSDVLTEANQQFSQLQNLKASNVKDLLSKIDDNTFTRSSLAFGIGKPVQGLSPENFYDNLLRKIMIEGSESDILSLQQLVGATSGSQKVFTPGKELFERLASRTLFDAFFMAHTNPKAPAIKTLRESMEQLRGKGIIKTDWADNAIDKVLNGQNPFDYKYLGVPSADDVGKIISDEDLIQRMGKDVTDIDVAKYIDINYEDLGSFDAASFLKNLGIKEGTGQANTLGARRGAMELILGGGKKGKENFKNLEDFAEMISVMYQVPLGNTSTFVARRIQLGGFQQFGIKAGAAGASFAAGIAFLPAVIVPLALLHFVGTIFQSPKVARALLDLATPEQNLKNMSKEVFGKKMQTKRQALGTILQHMLDNDPEDFPVADITKITEEQLVNYLQNKKLKVPNTDIKYDKVPEKSKEFMFPVEHSIQKLPPKKRREVREYLTEAQQKAFERYERFGPVAQSYLDASYTGETDTSANTMQATDTPAPVEPPKTTTPSLDMTGSTMQTTAQNTSFESLFPQDDLGTLIANNRKNKTVN